MTAINFNAEKHEYSLGNLIFPSVTQILTDLGMYGDAVNFYTEYGRVKGTFVHKIVHWDITDELELASVDEALKPYYQAWQAFKKDVDLQILEAENPLVNLTYGLAGTPDIIGELNDRPAIIDIKTGIVSHATSLQLAGYEILHGACVDRYSLQLKPDGKYSLKRYTDRKDREVFLSALACYHWKKNNYKK